MKIQVILKSFCKIEDKGNVDGTGHLYYFNNKQVPRRTYFNILRYLNKKYLNKKKYTKSTKTELLKNTKTRKITHIQWSFTFSLNIPKPILP